MPFLAVYRSDATRIIETYERNDQDTWIPYYQEITMPDENGIDTLKVSLQKLGSATTWDTANIY